MDKRRLAGVVTGLALSLTLVGSGAAQTYCERLLDDFVAGNDRAGAIYDLSCGNARLDVRFRPRGPKPYPPASERVIDTREMPLVPVSEEARVESIELVEEIREQFFGRPEE